MKRFLVYFAGCVLAIGCILNPQPHPPFEQGSTTPSGNGGAPSSGPSYDGGASDGSTTIIIGVGSEDATASRDAGGAVDAEGSRSDAAVSDSVDAADVGTAADAEAGPLDDADAGPLDDARATNASDADKRRDAVDETARKESD